MFCEDCGQQFPDFIFFKLLYFLRVYFLGASAFEKAFLFFSRFIDIGHNSIEERFFVLIASLPDGGSDFLLVLWGKDVLLGKVVDDVGKRGGLEVVYGQV